MRKKGHAHLDECQGLGQHCLNPAQEETQKTTENRKLIHGSIKNTNSNNNNDNDNSNNNNSNNNIRQYRNEKKKKNTNSRKLILVCS